MLEWTTQYVTLIQYSLSQPFPLVTPWYEEESPWDPSSYTLWAVQWKSGLFDLSNLRDENFNISQKEVDDPSLPNLWAYKELSCYTDIESSLSDVI